jgi:hypothetical protein
MDNLLNDGNMSEDHNKKRTDRKNIINTDIVSKTKEKKVSFASNYRIYLDFLYKI